MRSPIIVTGGAGFIGSNFILDWFANSPAPLVNFDKLTYAGNLHNLESISSRPEYRFVHGDICDRAAVEQAFRDHRPRAIVHFAAESHVDRSIVSPEAFLETNIRGTFVLLEAARAYVAQLAESERQEFRFLHVSTDEVYGSLGPNDPAFSETTPYSPNSPYAASKAGSDHLVRAYYHTFGLPCSSQTARTTTGLTSFRKNSFRL